MVVDISYFILLLGTAMVALLSAIFLFETIAAIALSEKAFAPDLAGGTRARIES